MSALFGFILFDFTKNLIALSYLLIAFSVLPFFSNFFAAAKKLEKKGKTEKAIKRYERAIKFLVKSNKMKPNKADTLNYLGFATRKTGDFENGEKYYLQGLAIEPNHIGINEYLGELYVATNRMNLAKERLSVLEGCNCEEYNQLKGVIDGSKKSKY